MTAPTIAVSAHNDIESDIPSDLEELNAEFEEDGDDMDHLFLGIDWSTANLGAFEQEWRQQLADIEQVLLLGGGVLMDVGG